MTPDRVAFAISSYFLGERRELVAFLGYAALLVLAAAALARTRDRFATALAICLVAIALIAAGTAIPLLRRDGPHRDALLAALPTPQGPAALDAERLRIDRVIANYPVYRAGFAAAAVVALGLLLFTHGAASRGVAVGLLLFAATGVVVDHYSETRARRYRDALAQAP